MFSSCPLCHSNGVKRIHSGEGRDYLQCGDCFLVHVPSEFHLSIAAERAVYDQHQNSPDDLNYRKFLEQLTVPLVARLNLGAHGLDFGSGPGPTLSVMLEEYEFQMATYDKYYADNPTVLAKSYDFITATEVVEHLATPGVTLNSLWQLIRPGGHLAIMTRMLPDEDEAFARWHYKRDPTHISFFAEQTLSWLAEEWQAALDISGNVAIFLKAD